MALWSRLDELLSRLERHDLPLMKYRNLSYQEAQGGGVY